MKEKKPFVIYRSADSEGETFALAPEAKETLEVDYKDVHRCRPRLFIAGFSEYADPRAQYAVVSLLTGLDYSKVSSLKHVEVRDPVTEEVIFRWTWA